MADQEQQGDRRTGWSKEFIFTILVFLLGGVGQYFALATRVATGDVQNGAIKTSVDKIEKNTDAIRDKVDQLGNTVGQQNVRLDAITKDQLQEHNDRVQVTDQLKAWLDTVKDRVTKLEAKSEMRR